MKKFLAAIAISATALTTGCASVPMAQVEADAALKQFMQQERQGYTFIATAWRVNPSRKPSISTESW